MKNTVIAIALTFGLTFFVWHSIINKKNNKSINNEKVQILELPFQQNHAKVIARTQEGNKEIITYEHEGKKYQEVNITKFDEAGKKEQEIIDVMLSTITSLGINSTNTERTAKNLCLIRQRFDWNNSAYPSDWKSAPDFIGSQSFQLKQAVYQEINNDDADVVASILNADIPFAHPPMYDYIVRNDENGVYQEIKSIETNRAWERPIRVNINN